MQYHRIHINGKTFKSFEEASRWLIATGQHDMLKELRRALVFMRTHNPLQSAEFIDMAFSLDEDVYRARKPKPRKSTLLGDIKKSKSVNEFLKLIRRKK